MPTYKPTELSRIKLKTWTQQPVPMMSEHSAHLTSLPFGFRTWLWRYTCLLLLISMLWHRQAIYIHTYIFVVVNFDALAQASDIQIERRQVVFLCWMQDLNPGPRHQIASRLNARWQTDWAIEDQAIKLELDSPSLWSASIQPTWPHCQLTFAPGSGDIHICCC